MSVRRQPGQVPEELEAEARIDRRWHPAHGPARHQPLREPDVRVLVAQGDVGPGDVAHLLGVERPADRDKNLHRQGDAFAIDTVEHLLVPIGELHVAASGLAVLVHRDAQPVGRGHLLGLGIAGVDVPDDALPGSLVSTRSSFSAASAVPSATVTCPAWMERPMPTPPPWWIDTHEAPGGGVEQRVQKRPVGDGVGAVAHAPRSPGTARRPIRSRGGRGRSRSAPAASPLATMSLKRSPGRSPLAVAEPADPRRQPLEVHRLAGHPDPPGERLVVRELLQHGLVGRGDVLRVTRQRGPPERAPCPRRTAAGCTRARSRESRRRARSHRVFASARIELP